MRKTTSYSIRQACLKLSLSIREVFVCFFGLALRFSHLTIFSKRPWPSGWASAFHAEQAGSIPAGRSIHRNRGITECRILVCTYLKGLWKPRLFGG